MAGGYEETLKRLPRRGYHKAVSDSPMNFDGRSMVDGMFGGGML